MSRFQTVLYVTTFIWYGLLFAVTTMLIAEYRYFKQQSQTIEQVKDDYTTSILALQKVLSEYENIKSEEAIKKKVDEALLSDSISDFKNDFVVVNRSFERIKQNSLDFAKKQNLYKALLDLYDQDYNPVNNSYKNSYQKTSVNTFIKSSSNLHSNNSCNRWRRLQKQPVFMWPLNKSTCWISSTFGPRKKINGTWGFHNGIDMAALKGTDVYAADSGKVIEARYLKGYGNTIIIKHNNIFKTRYAHLDKILIKLGAQVKKGDIIGKVGDTGFVRKKGKDASHLHFEVYHHDKRVNPFYFLE